MNTVFKFSGLSILFLLAGLIYFPFLGEVNLFDPDETMIASISKEMFEKSEVLQAWLNGKYFVDLPPFFFWIQLISFKYLGINEYAARFPNAICALLVILTLYKNGKRIYSTSFGMMWALIYMTMILPQFYHKSGLVEPWFCFFIYLGLYNFSRVIEARQERKEDFYKSRDVISNLFYSAFAIAGAVMTKGVEGYIVVLLSYWFVFIFSMAKYGFGYKNILRWTIYLILLLGIWVGLEFKWHGLDYLKLFFENQWYDLDIKKASWSYRFTFPFIILFLGCFPASAIFLNSFKVKSYESTIQKIFRLMMVGCLFIVIVITCLFKNKIAHYSALAYYPISYLAAYSLRFILEDKVQLRKFTLILIALGGLIWTAALTIVPITRLNIKNIKQYVHEDTLLDALTRNYPWQNFEILIGVLFFTILVLFFILVYRNKIRLALIILFFSCMIVSEIVLVYYVPKIEQYTQGSQVDFIKQNLDEKAYFHYFGGKSFIPNFYQTRPYFYNEKFSFDSLNNYKLEQVNHYLIFKKSDSTSLSMYSKNLVHLYNQGIYSFYKLKKSKPKNNYK
jgi:4-amino-4-deoxy-L-arabinose transferase-like glycosyltransferase